ncbi:MAG: hypothetical protein KAR87_03385, partial [Candidatus Aenigmarchaeota archaeon]|nr:hypothetical protein [Candidatus Aenigmarchaeota archaeon]
PNIPILDLLENNTNTTNNTPFFNWTISADIDDDTITYAIQIDNNSDFTSPEQVNHSLTLNNYTANILTDDTYFWRVKAITSDANSTYTTYRIFTVDTTPPNITIINPPNNTNIPAGLDWTWINISTDENAICRYNITDSNFNFATEGADFTNTGELNHSFNYSVEDDYTYTFFYKCNDSFGNTNTGSTTHTFWVDPTTPPYKPELNSPENDTYITKNYALLNWTCTDPEGDMMTAYIYADNSTATTLINTTTGCQNGSSYTFNWTNLNDTTYYWRVNCTDTGGFSNISDTWQFTVDTAPPEINIISPLAKKYSDNTIWFNVTLNEVGNWCGYSLDGASNITMTNASGNWNAKNTSMTIKQHNVIFYCNDSAGNMDSTPTRYFEIIQLTGKLYVSLALPNSNYVCSRQSGIVDAGAVSFNYSNPEEAYVNSFGSNIVYSLSSDRAAIINAQNYPVNHKISIYTNSDVYLGFTKGDCQTITKKYSMIKDSTLLYELSPAFAYIDVDDKVSIRAGARYSNTNLTGDIGLTAGAYELMIKNKGRDSSREEIINIRRN